MAIHILLAVGAALCQPIMALTYLTYIQAAQYKIPSKGKFVKTVYFHIALVVGAALLALIVFASLGEKAFAITVLAEFCVMLTVFTAMYCKKRNKFVFTDRGKRLFSLTLTPVIPTLLCIAIPPILIEFAAVFFLLIIYPILTSVINNIAAKYEDKRNKIFVENAKNSLSASKAIKIGITGSYGKTSCKNILTALLSEKYKVFATPGNYNTPMGIAKAVQQMPLDSEIFIAEMGARHPGDIRQLVDIVQPSCGILTGLAEQHLETFLNFDNICTEKRVLLEELPIDGFAVLNGNDATAWCMKGKFAARSVTAGFDEIINDISCSEITINQTLGSSFKLKVFEKSIDCETSLLGKHNVENILVCVAMATRFGLTIDEIASGIAKLRPIKHRMEPLSRGLIRIIDDSYNCNIAGASAAFGFLNELSGRKIIFSQGIVEGGEKEEKINVFLGELMASVCDIVLLCGGNAKWLKRGLNNKNFSGEIKEYKKFSDVVKIFPSLLKSGDILYIQNDIPDNF